MPTTNFPPIDLERLRAVVAIPTGAVRTDKVVADALAFCASNASSPDVVLGVLRRRGDVLNDAFMDMSRRPEAPGYADVDATAMATARDVIMNMASVVEHALDQRVAA